LERGQRCSGDFGGKRANGLNMSFHSNNVYIFIWLLIDVAGVKHSCELITVSLKLWIVSRAGLALT
jgi:hypothetical protein